MEADEPRSPPALPFGCKIEDARSIDYATWIPKGLYDELMRAAQKTRMRGQHRRVKGPSGICRLQSNSSIERQLLMARQWAAARRQQK